MTCGTRPRGRVRAPGWIAWWGLWALITLPWGDVQQEPQWQRVEWVPFQLGLLRDAALNFLFFVPFGILATRPGRAAGRVAAAAAVVSVATELLQLYAGGRFPSATDVVVNVAGAFSGSVAARWWRGPIRPSAPSPRR